MTKNNAPYGAPGKPPAQVDAESGMESQAATKVCRKCSVQSQTAGNFCPQCGKSYLRGRPRPSRKALGIACVAVLLLAGTATGVALKVKHDRSEERAAAAAEQKEVAAAAEAKKVAAREAQEAEVAAAEAAEEEARSQRSGLIKQMQASITKDAKQRVNDGELEGPIFYTSCDPLGGGSVDDLTALTTTFECLAVHEKLKGGQVRGWVFSSTMNWDEGSWSWRLGN